MKRTFIITGIIVVITIIGLIAFNKLFSKKDKTDIFVEANYGKFEITINAAGELMAERAIDIMGPEIFSPVTRAETVVPAAGAAVAEAWTSI